MLRTVAQCHVQEQANWWRLEVVGGRQGGGGHEGRLQEHPVRPPAAKEGSKQTPRHSL
jgi:hypothetical protein